MDMIRCKRHALTNAERALLSHLTMSKIDHSERFSYSIDYRTDMIVIFCSEKIKEAFEMARQSDSYQFANFIISFTLNTDSDSETTSSDSETASD